MSDDSSSYNSSKRSRDSEDDNEEKGERTKKQSRISSFPRRPRPKTVHWDSLAVGRWGQIPLTSYIPVRELDSLVGWATHIEDSKATTEPNHNPLVDLPNSPLPPSILQMLRDAAWKAINADEKKKNLFEAFDQSALVALGMLLEEMITASLVPIAELHVKRCRRLEEQDSSRSRAFQEWTLPPEEAIMEIINDDHSRQDDEVSLPIALPPTRTAVPDAPKWSLLNLPLTETRNQQAGFTWCQSQRLDPTFVIDNMDVFSIFLPDEPATKRVQL